MHFSGEVTEDSVDAVISWLRREQEWGAAAVVIELDTPGGDIEQGARLVKQILDSPVPVFCLARKAASMGFVLLEHCYHRAALQDAHLMIHYPYGVLSVGNVRFIVPSSEDLKATWAQLVAHRMQSSVNYVRDRLDHGDWKMTPEEALVEGALDQVTTSSAAYYESLPGLIKSARTRPFCR